MQIRHYEDYVLSPEHRKQFGLEVVRTGFDQDLDHLVLNLPENGIMAGDQLRSKRNPRFDDTRPNGADNPRYIFSLTDDYNYDEAINIVAAKQIREGHAMQQTVGTLAVVSADLPRLLGAAPGDYTRFQSALDRILGENSRVYDKDKVKARDEVEGSLKLFESRGLNVPDIVRSKVVRAAGSFAVREGGLRTMREVTESRRQKRLMEKQQDDILKLQLRRLGDTTTTISGDTDRFLALARRRNTKPGVLTVNNAWYHRDEAESWQAMLLGQDGFEPLYGALMSPMNRLAAKTLKDIAAEPEAVIGRYSVRLEALLDVLDLAHVGGDYDALCDRLQEKVFAAEELLLNERFSEALKVARQYKFLLRYRALPGERPPEQWYTGLPGVKDGRAVPDDMTIDEIFDGLPK